MGDPGASSCIPSSCTTAWKGGRLRVDAEPFYLGEHSKPDQGEYVFGYRIEIANLGPESARLLWRRWTITDGDGTVREVQGSGVVGEQPTLASGERFEYRSFCPLPTSTGTMEGAFTFQGVLSAGEILFEVRIAPFEMNAADAGARAGRTG